MRWRNGPLASRNDTVADAVVVVVHVVVGVVARV